MPENENRSAHRRPYSTYVYPVENLNKPAYTLAQGAYPQAVGFDPTGASTYSQNFGHALIVFDESGIKQKEYALDAGRDVKQLLPHPSGRKLLMVTEAKVLYIELATD
jgi:hypothetical protein